MPFLDTAWYSRLQVGDARVGDLVPLLAKDVCLRWVRHNKMKCGAVLTATVLARSATAGVTLGVAGFHRTLVLPSDHPRVQHYVMPEAINR